MAPLAPPPPPPQMHPCQLTVCQCMFTLGVFYILSCQCTYIDQTVDSSICFPLMTSNLPRWWWQIKGLSTLNRFIITSLILTPTFVQLTPYWEYIQRLCGGVIAESAFIVTMCYTAVKRNGCLQLVTNGKEVRPVAAWFCCWYLFIVWFPPYCLIYCCYVCESV